MALRSDPGNAYLNLHLANTMRRKVEIAAACERPGRGTS